MFKRGVALFLAVGASVTPSAAVAQQFTDTESVRALYRQAYCSVRRDPAIARKLFATPPGSKEEAKLIRSLGANPCLPVGFGLPYLDSNRQLMRGVIAEALLDDARANKKHLIDPSEAPFATLSDAAVDALGADGKASLAGLDFAQCIVEASPEGVEKLLSTSATRSTQDKAFDQLAPYLGPCLPKGAQVTFSKLMLRGLIAEAEYRSSYFPTAAGKH